MGAVWAEAVSDRLASARPARSLQAFFMGVGGEEKQGKKNFSSKVRLYTEMANEQAMNTPLMHFTERTVKFTTLLVSILLMLATACGSSKSTFTQSGQGSYYADKFAGKRTASGTPYRPGKLTAAHNTLPFGTKIKVTNAKTGRSVKVKGRIVDLSKKAAKRIGLVDAGVAPVQLKVVKAVSTK
jgi:rare lipoprotein A